MGWRVRAFIITWALIYAAVAVIVLRFSSLTGADAGTQQEEMQRDSRTTIVADVHDEPSFDVALIADVGRIRLRLFPSAPLAGAFIGALLNLTESPGSPAGPCRACSLYRAEAVPSSWGSLDLPDSSFGGRWGPPYALLQGSLGPNGPQVRAGAPALYLSKTLAS